MVFAIIAAVLTVAALVIWAYMRGVKSHTKLLRSDDMKSVPKEALKLIQSMFRLAKENKLDLIDTTKTFSSVVWGGLIWENSEDIPIAAALKFKELYVDTGLVDELKGRLILEILLAEALCTKR